MILTKKVWCNKLIDSGNIFKERFFSCFKWYMGHELILNLSRFSLSILRWGGWRLGFHSSSYGSCYAYSIFLSNSSDNGTTEIQLIYPLPLFRISWAKTAATTNLQYPISFSHRRGKDTLFRFLESNRSYSGLIFDEHHVIFFTPGWGISFSFERWGIPPCVQ